MITRDFLTAGKAVFTVEIPPAFAAEFKTPPHYTYKIRKKKGDAKWADKFFVGLLTGPDNEADYTYLGVFEDGAVRLTDASKLSEDSWPIRILRRIVAKIWTNEESKITEAGWDVHHEGTCCRCGRTLTVPESVKTGIGPECRKHVESAAF